MRVDLRRLLIATLTWAILFVPFAHSAVMSAHAAPLASSVPHHAAAAAHDHGDASSHWHEETESEDGTPASFDPCTMCQSHPVCHMVVLPEPLFVLPAPEAPTFEIGQSVRAPVLAFKPPLTPPRA